MRSFGKIGRAGFWVASKPGLRAGMLKQLPLLLIVLLALGAGAAGLAFAGPSDTDEPANGEDPRAFEQELALLESEARVRWPESFAGLWGSAGNAPNHIYVAFVGNPQRKVEQLGADFQASDLLVPVPARYSLEHLERLQARMIADRTSAQRGALDLPPGLAGGRYDLDISLRENVVEAIIPASIESARAGVTQNLRGHSQSGEGRCASGARWHFATPCLLRSSALRASAARRAQGSLRTRRTSVLLHLGICGDQTGYGCDGNPLGRPLR